jgi:hypothetical protein
VPRQLAAIVSFRSAKARAFAEQKPTIRGSAASSAQGFRAGKLNKL